MPYTFEVGDKVIANCHSDSPAACVFNGKHGTIHSVTDDDLPEFEVTFEGGAYAWLAASEMLPTQYRVGDRVVVDNIKGNNQKMLTRYVGTQGEVTYSNETGVTDVKLDEGIIMTFFSAELRPLVDEVVEAGKAAAKELFSTDTASEALATAKSFAQALSSPQPLEDKLAKAFEDAAVRAGDNYSAENNAGFRVGDRVIVNPVDATTEWAPGVAGSSGYIKSISDSDEALPYPFTVKLDDISNPRVFAEEELTRTTESYEDAYDEWNEFDDEDEHPQAVSSTGIKPNDSLEFVVTEDAFLHPGTYKAVVTEVYLSGALQVEFIQRVEQYPPNTLVMDGVGNRWVYEGDDCWAGVDNAVTAAGEDLIGPITVIAEAK